MPITKAATAFLIAITAAACAPPVQPETARPRTRFEAVADSLVHAGLREAHWGIEVWDQGRNQMLYGHNWDKHFIPASNTKLVVTTVAMGLLGPDWRYQTPIMIAAAQGDSMARALIIKGSGDPTMSGRYFGSDLAVLDSMADSLYVKGIRRITGDIIIDATAFTRDRIHPSWEIGDLPWYYAAPTSAFAVGEAAVRMVASANEVTFPGGFAPAPVAMSVTSDTGSTNSIDIDFAAWPDTLMVTGRLASGKADSSWIAQPIPERYAAEAFVSALERKNILVDGSIRIVYDRGELAGLPATRTIMTWTSPPMKDIVAGILKPSQNWIAEQVLKTLGYIKGDGGTWRAGLNVERRYLIDVVKIDSTAFSLTDASGLSAQNLLAPHAIILLLEHARTSSWGPQYHAALPVPGGSGTLSSRLPGLETRLAAKTGTISNVNSLSGYVTTANGRQLTFSLMTNASGRSSAQMRRGMDALIQELARVRPAE